MNHDEKDELWNLLGKARVPKERPFFAGKVLREITQVSRDRGFDVWALIRRIFYPVAAGVCAAALAVFIFRDGKDVQTTPIAGVTDPVQQADPLAEFAAVVAESDELDSMVAGLLAADSNSLWLYADPSSLY